VNQAGEGYRRRPTDDHPGGVEWAKVEGVKPVQGGVWNSTVQPPEYLPSLLRHDQCEKQSVQEPGEPLAVLDSAGKTP